MKKQICSLALSTVFGLGVALAAPQAQDQPAQGNAPAEANGPAHRQADPNEQLKHMSKRLNLTADQQNQILPILTSRQQAMENLRADNSMSPRDRHAKMQSIREDSEARIRAVLTDTQKQAYDQMREQMRAREQQRREQRQNPNQGS